MCTAVLAESIIRLAKIFNKQTHKAQGIFMNDSRDGLTVESTEKCPG